MADHKVPTYDSEEGIDMVTVIFSKVTTEHSV